MGTIQTVGARTRSGAAVDVDVFGAVFIFVAVFVVGGIVVVGGGVFGGYDGDDDDVEGCCSCYCCYCKSLFLLWLTFRMVMMLFRSQLLDVIDETLLVLPVRGKRHSTHAVVRMR